MWHSGNSNKGKTTIGIEIESKPNLTDVEFMQEYQCCYGLGLSEVDRFRFGFHEKTFQFGSVFCLTPFRSM